jgi:hypothetical protein
VDHALLAADGCGAPCWVDVRACVPQVLLGCRACRGGERERRTSKTTWRLAQTVAGRPLIVARAGVQPLVWGAPPRTRTRVRGWYALRPSPDRGPGDRGPRVRRIVAASTPCIGMTSLDVRLGLQECRGGSSRSWWATSGTPVADVEGEQEQELQSSKTGASASSSIA